MVGAERRSYRTAVKSCSWNAILYVDRLWLCSQDFVQLHCLCSLHLRQPTYASHDLALLSIKTRGGSRGATGAIAPLKPTKVTLFTMILYNSENSICNIRPFCRLLFCHSNVVKYTSSLLQ